MWTEFLMKLVTFDNGHGGPVGRVGRVDGDTVVVLDCGSTREFFERGGAGAVGETGETLPLAEVRLRAPIVPKKFFHTAGNFAEHHEELAAVQPDPFDFYLRPGDVIEAEIASVGLLRNHVVSWKDAYGTTPPEGVSL
jgi:2-keto-4-pentenoate hydratase/2-oxohepta-3-ene-1,7-dioic acid hydratase in catechol pathway